MKHISVTAHSLFVLASLQGALWGCGEQNEGNVTPPPPPFVFATVPSGGGSGSVLPGVGGGSATESDVNKPLPSTGCGQALPAEQVETIPGSRTGYTMWFVNQTGATLAEDVPAGAGERQFFVRVPFDYDPNKPYRVVYIGQGCGAQRAGKTNTHPLFLEAQGGTEQAIYVGLSVHDNSPNTGCYDNNSGAKSVEWEAFDLIHAFVEKTYCVDNNRVFVDGYSTGGWLANMYSCYFGGTPSPPLDDADLKAGRTERKFSPKWAVRGGVRMTGSLPPNQPRACNGPSAGLWIHDTLDKSNLLETNVAALNLALKTNGCEGDYENGPKRTWAPAEDIPGLQGGLCQEYTGCSPEMSKNYPLVFCTTTGFGHADQPSVIPAATKFFDMMNPAP